MQYQQVAETQISAKCVGATHVRKKKRQSSKSQLKLLMIYVSGILDKLIKSTFLRISFTQTILLTHVLLLHETQTHLDSNS